MRTPGTVNAQVNVHARRGHGHLFTLTDPSAAELARLCSDRTVEVFTTDGETNVQVVGVDAQADKLVVLSRDGGVYRI